MMLKVMDVVKINNEFTKEAMGELIASNAKVLAKVTEWVEEGKP